MKEWKKPTIALLNRQINSGGSATNTPYPEYIAICLSPGNVTVYDQAASFPAYLSLIIPGSYGATFATCS